MGQSEMRVGMRSDEFGNISISTTASKGAITAQISLDHGELAKIISAQLPEMQTRLGSGQTVNVHIDMNSTGTGQGAGQGSGQGSGTSGNTANSSYDQSRGGGQQASYAASSYESGNIAESQLSPVIATAITGYASGKSRLDIRV
jgi:flagellar hook-length control protein FliK